MRWYVIWYDRCSGVEITMDVKIPRRRSCQGRTCAWWRQPRWFSRVVPTQENGSILRGEKCKAVLHRIAGSEKEILYCVSFDRLEMRKVGCKQRVMMSGIASKGFTGGVDEISEFKLSTLTRNWQSFISWSIFWMNGKINTLEKGMKDNNNSSVLFLQ